MKYKSPASDYIPRFCNRSCSNYWQHANGIRRDYRSDKTTKQWWIEKYGEEDAKKLKEQFRETMSKVTSGKNNPMYGRKGNFAKATSFTTGKTLEEIHGFEKAQKLKENLSKKFSGKNNPAYGKVYFNGGKSVKGYYSGKFFRSLLEYSFMKHLEKTGLDIDDISYENFCIPYLFENRERTYTPDFYLPQQNLVYEVKPFYAINFEINKLKFDAAKNFFFLKKIEFKVVTEKDFEKISFKDARKDKNINWNEETFKYFKGVRN